MVQCDVFDAVVTLEEDKGKQWLVWKIITDLPVGTFIILTCKRTYLDMRGDLCIWTGYNEKLEILPNDNGNLQGANGRIDVNASDKKARELFDEISTGIASTRNTVVSDELSLGFTVGARQRLRVFGKYNAELHGKMVSKNGDINVVVKKESLNIPMKKEFQPKSD